MKTFHDDMHSLSKELFTGLPFALGSMILFRSLIVFPLALASVYAIQKNASKLYICISHMKKSIHTQKTNRLNDSRLLLFGLKTREFENLIFFPKITSFLIS